MNFSRSLVLVLTISSASPLAMARPFMVRATRQSKPASMRKWKQLLRSLQRMELPRPTMIALPMTAIGTMALATFSKATSWVTWVEG